MAKKKSRKIGQIGIPKANVPKGAKKPKAPERSKTTRGNKSGTRQQQASVDDSQSHKEKKDPRLGSKKPIDLTRYKAGATNVETKKTNKDSIVKYKTPQEELEAIENNQELERLLEKQASSKLSASEQAFVDKLTDRYRVLCELMGIEVNDIDIDDQENQSEDDPFAKLDAIKLDDFKD